jgi:putative ABC transport system permease protein
MLLLTLRNLRARPGRTILTALAIALGVAMIFAMRITAIAITQSTSEARQNRLAGADLEITAATTARLPQSFIDSLAAYPDIETVSPLFRGLEGSLVPNPTGNLMAGPSLQGTGLILLGVDPGRTLNPYQLEAGSFLSAPDAAELLLPATWAEQNGHTVGSTLNLTTGDHQQEYTIVGLLAADEQSALSAPTAWLPLTTLQAAFAAPDSATSVLVRLQPGRNQDQVRDELQAFLGRQYIVSSARGGSASLSSLFNLTNLALPFAGFVILLAGAFLVFNAFAITLAERRREIGQLRTLGMTRRQVMNQTLLEAFLVALTGSAIGLLFGWLLGSGMSAVLSRLQTGNSAANSFTFPLSGAALALAAGLLVTLAVTLTLAYNAGRIPPLEAFRINAKSDPTSTRLPLILAAIGLIGLFATFLLNRHAERLITETTDDPYGPLFLVSFTLGLTLLTFLPLWLNGWITLWGRFTASPLLSTGRFRPFAITARLAAGNLERQRSRAILTAATLTIGLMVVILLSGLALFMQGFLFAMNNQGILTADVVLIRTYQPGGSFEQIVSLPSLPPMPAALQADVDALSDIATVAYFANVSLPGLGLDTGMGDQYAFAMEPGKIAGNAFFPIAEGSWEEAETYFTPGPASPAIMLPTATARRLDLHPGDSLTIDTLQGPVEFTIALVGGGFPIVTPAVAQQHFGSHPFGLLIDARPGVDQATLQERVDAILERHPAELGAFDMEQRQTVIDQVTGPIIALFIGLTSISGLVAALGIVITLIAAVLERQREIGTLRALGLTRRQVRATIVYEAGLLALAGATLGASAGLAMTFAFGRLMILSMEAVAGVNPLDTAPIPWAVALAAVLLSPAIAMLAALHPANRAASIHPAEAMRDA